MNEKQVWTILHNLDQEVLEKELDNLMEKDAVDVDAILHKAVGKLDRRQVQRAGRRRKIISVAAAAACIVIGATAVYAEELSALFRSLTGKSTVYETVLEGQAYYLEKPLDLEGIWVLHGAMFHDDTLQLVIDGGGIESISVSAGAAGAAEPDGYSRGPNGDEFYFYQISPVQELVLQLNGKDYPVRLSSPASVLEGGNIVEGKSGIGWVSIGHRSFAGGVQIFTSFDDDRVTLRSIGMPLQSEVRTSFVNNPDGSGGGSSTSAMAGPLVGKGANGAVYEYNFDADEMGRPLTRFYSDAPAGARLQLEIPALVVYCDKQATAQVSLPAQGERQTINKAFDLGLQSMVLEHVERTSPTTAELVFRLDTGGDKAVAIRDVALDSMDLAEGAAVFADGRCIFTATFAPDTQSFQLLLSQPSFVVKGGWTLEVEA